MGRLQMLCVTIERFGKSHILHSQPYIRVCAAQLRLVSPGQANGGPLTAHHPSPPTGTSADTVG